MDAFPQVAASGWEHSKCWLFLVHLVPPHLAPVIGHISLFSPNPSKSRMSLYSSIRIFSLIPYILPSNCPCAQVPSISLRPWILNSKATVLYFFLSLCIFAGPCHHWTWTPTWVNEFNEPKKIIGKKLPQLNFKNAILPHKQNKQFKNRDKLLISVSQSGKSPTLYLEFICPFALKILIPFQTFKNMWPSSTCNFIYF